MPDTSTVYDIKIPYLVEDHASAPLEHMAHSAEHAESAFDQAKESLKTLGEIFLIKEGFEKGKEFFIDANAGMQRLTIQTTALMQANGLAKTFEEAHERAGELIETMEKSSLTKGVMGTDMVSFYNSVSMALGAAGASLERGKDFAEKGLITAKAFGYSGDEAASQINRAVMHQASFRMEFVRQVLAQQHMTMDQFNALDKGGRTNVFERFFNSGSALHAVDEYGKSWEAITTNLKNFFEQTMRGVGLPLFKAVSDELKNWGDWLNDHPKEVAQFAKELSDGLIRGFTIVRQVFGFIYDHRQTFMDLGKSLALSKLSSAFAGTGGARGSMGSILGGAATGFGISQLIGDHSALSVALNTTMGAVGSFGGEIGRAAQGLQLLYIALQRFADQIDDMHKEQIEDKTEAGSVLNALSAAKDAKDLVAAQPNIDSWSDTWKNIRETDAAFGQMASKLHEYGLTRDMTAEQRNQLIGSKLDANWYNDDSTKQGFKEMVDLLFKNMDDHLADIIYGKKKSSGGGEGTNLQQNVNVTIQRIEVASDDPDRFVVGLQRVVNNARKNRPAPRRALPGGA